MTPAGLEPAIPGSVGRCLIHWATGPYASLALPRDERLHYSGSLTFSSQRILFDYGWKKNKCIVGYLFKVYLFCFCLYLLCF